MPRSQAQRTTQQLIFVPVFGLRLTKAVDKELQVARVMFIEADKIPRVRKRLGFKHTIGDYRDMLGGKAGEKLLRESLVYACLKTKRDPNSKDFSSEMAVIREAFWILASSFFSLTWRKDAALSLHPYGGPRMIKDIYIFERSTDKFWVKWEIPHPIPNSLDNEWKRVSRYYHFFDLLKILEGKRKVQPKWKQALTRASVLAGQSFLARHIAEAFLCNMIAIEMLLVQRGERFPDTLIDRIVALFGWMTGEDPSPWKGTVERLYQLRCAYVHDGYSGDISGMDLFESDTLLKNLLLNLCKSTQYIKSKSHIIRLADELQARRVLGMKPLRVVKKLHFMRTRLDSSTRKKIEDVGAWTW